MESTEDKVRKIVVEHLGVDADKVTTDAKLDDDLGADSLDTVELAMGCEEEFDIEIPDDEADAVSTFGDLVKLVEKLKAG